MNSSGFCAGYGPRNSSRYRCRSACRHRSQHSPAYVQTNTETYFERRKALSNELSGELPSELCRGLSKELPGEVLDPKARAGNPKLQVLTPKSQTPNPKPQARICGHTERPFDSSASLRATRRRLCNLRIVLPDICDSWRRGEAQEFVTADEPGMLDHGRNTGSGRGIRVNR
jgi:hypothetical protein